MESALQQLDMPAQARSVPEQLHGEGLYSHKKHDENVSVVTSSVAPMHVTLADGR